MYHNKRKQNPFLCHVGLLWKSGSEKLKGASFYCWKAENAGVPQILEHLTHAETHNIQKNPEQWKEPLFLYVLLL